MVVLEYSLHIMFLFEHSLLTSIDTFGANNTVIFVFLALDVLKEVEPLTLHNPVLVT